MGYRTVTVDVDVNVNDVVNEMKDQELIDELNRRGYTVVKDEAFDREDWQYLLEMIDKLPYSWYTNRIREKIARMRYEQKHYI